MNQLEFDAVIMRQIFEKVMEVIADNQVLYNKENIARLANILMALSVNMIGMSSNSIADFKKNAQSIVDKMVNMLDNMEPNKRNKLMTALDDQLDWFEKEYNKHLSQN